MSTLEQLRERCDKLITAGLLDGEPYDDAKEYIEALETEIAGYREADSIQCGECDWQNTRHQKCTCCKRNRNLKDNYSPAPKRKQR